MVAVQPIPMAVTSGLPPLHMRYHTHLALPHQPMAQPVAFLTQPLHNSRNCARDLRNVWVSPVDNRHRERVRAEHDYGLVTLRLGLWKRGLDDLGECLNEPNSQPDNAEVTESRTSTRPGCVFQRSMTLQRTSVPASPSVALLFMMSEDV